MAEIELPNIEQIRKQLRVHDREMAVRRGVEFSQLRRILELTDSKIQETFDSAEREMLKEEATKYYFDAEKLAKSEGIVDLLEPLYKIYQSIKRR